MSDQNAETGAALTPFWWDANKRVYTWKSNGQVVTPVRLREWVSEAIEGARGNLRTIAEDLLAGRINRAEWAIRSGQELKNLHRSLSMLANGGKSQMNASSWGRVGQRLQSELRYFNRFASLIDNKELSELGAGFLSRAGSYANAGWATYQNAIRALGIEAGDEERNILGASAHSCGECIDLANEEWVPAGTLPAIGDRECGSGCNCSFEFRAAAEEAAISEVA